MNDLSIIVARKQKRILDWKKAFSANQALDLKEKEQINQSLNTLSLLLGKLITATGKELEETKSRIEALDRELVNMYETSRLLTAPQGTAALSQ